MALIPENEQHEFQINAGTKGRKRGHAFEKELASMINSLDTSKFDFKPQSLRYRMVGDPSIELVKHIALDRTIAEIKSVRAYWLGGLATSGLGDIVHYENGGLVNASKSDILLKLDSELGEKSIGISVKTCNKKTPTNDQMYFTTARAFCRLLRENGIGVAQEVELGLRKFCGDEGFRPRDTENSEILERRKSDPDRWFFEELPEILKEAIIELFSDNQRDITLILFKYAYTNDPFPPNYLIHQTVKYDDIQKCDLAIFPIKDLVDFSCKYSGFTLRPYRVRKGRFKDDPNLHYAPRFGYIQFQRGGQRQHPTQLQFNLQTGYFDKLPI